MTSRSLLSEEPWLIESSRVVSVLQSVEVEPAVHFDDFAVHEIGGIAAKKDCNPGNLIRCSDATHGRALRNVVKNFLFPARRHPRHNQAGALCVASDVVFAEIESK